jgi:hypothetical protein
MREDLKKIQEVEFVQKLAQSNEKLLYIVSDAIDNTTCSGDFSNFTSF